MKKIMVLLTVFTLFTFTITGCGKDTKGNSGEEPKTEPKNEESIVKPEVISVEQTSLQYDKKKGITLVNFKVANISDKDQYVESINVTYSIDFNPITTKIEIKDTLVPSQEVELSITSSYDLTDIGNLEYKVLEK